MLQTGVGTRQKMHVSNQEDLINNGSNTIAFVLELFYSDQLYLCLEHNVLKEVSSNIEIVKV